MAVCFCTGWDLSPLPPARVTRPPATSSPPKPHTRHAPPTTAATAHHARRGRVAPPRSSWRGSPPPAFADAAVSRGRRRRPSPPPPPSPLAAPAPLPDSMTYHSLDYIVGGSRVGERGGGGGAESLGESIDSPAISRAGEVRLGGPLSPASPGGRTGPRAPRWPRADAPRADAPPRWQSQSAVKTARAWRVRRHVPPPRGRQCMFVTNALLRIPLRGHTSGTLPLPESPRSPDAHGRHPAVPVACLPPRGRVAEPRR